MPYSKRRFGFSIIDITICTSLPSPLSSLIEEEEEEKEEDEEEEEEDDDEDEEVMLYFISTTSKQPLLTTSYQALLSHLNSSPGTSAIADAIV
jgi:hypothetical protein